MSGRHVAPRRRFSQRKRALPIKRRRALIVLALACPALLTSTVASSAVFTDTVAARGVYSADKLKPPTNLTISTSVGKTVLTWKRSASTYVQGYEVLRSTSVYGPWQKVGTVTGAAATTFTDTTGGVSQWHYRVEATSRNWVSTGEAFQAPPPVGREFFDGFNGTSPLDGRPTEDGASTWLVWSGYVDTHWTNIGTEYAAYGSADGRGVAVVRTPSNDGLLYAEDFDGHEAFIVRGKDPQNYIYAGGIGVNSGFHLIQVRDGVRTTLKSDLAAGLDQNMRLEAQGNTINVYKNATRGNDKSGTLLMSVTTTFLAGDPTATYFGIGFANERYGINDFTFKALGW